MAKELQNEQIHRVIHEFQSALMQSYPARLLSSLDVPIHRVALAGTGGEKPSLRDCNTCSKAVLLLYMKYEH